MSDEQFNPSQHLTSLKGKDYLEVKWRLVWFREEYPRGTITTEHIEVTKDWAVFRATVRKITEEGEEVGMATGYGSETIDHFGDYLEKAETKAIGRAMAALGYGTQFAPELEEGERIVDSPVQRPTPIRQQQKSVQRPRQNDGKAHQTAMASLHAKASELNIDHDTLRSLAIAIEKKEQGRDITSLTEAPTQLLVFLRGQIKDNLDGLRREFPQAFERDADLNPTDEELGIDARAAF